MSRMAPWTDVDCVRCVSLHELKWQCQVFMDTCETILKWPKRPVSMATGKWIPAEARVRLHESKEAFQFHVTVRWHSHAPHIYKEWSKTKWQRNSKRPQVNIKRTEPQWSGLFCSTQFPVIMTYIIDKKCNFDAKNYVNNCMSDTLSFKFCLHLKTHIIQTGIWGQSFMDHQFRVQTFCLPA